MNFLRMHIVNKLEKQYHVCWSFYLAFGAKVIEGHVYKSCGSRRKKYSG